MSVGDLILVCTALGVVTLFGTTFWLMGVVAGVQSSVTDILEREITREHIRKGKVL